MNDQEILAAMNVGGLERENALFNLYSDKELRNTINMYIVRHGGNEADFEDVFQDAIIIFDRNVRIGKFRGDSTIKAYLVSVARYSYISRLRKQEKTVFSNFIVPDNVLYEDEYANYEQNEIDDLKKQVFEDVIEKLGGSCKTILALSFSGASMDEIATNLGYPNVMYLRKKKYLCLQKLRKLIQEDKRIIELIRSRPL